ncbi:MAG: signal peptidase I [Candidatus Endonucleobacter sp. (ex Gigantidas childressi)]|nr:signal peptidase I [Candidatus Endonucleobacter sp. (ex Gigantidas childressi)]
MDINFPLLLVLAVFITGGIALVDMIVLRSRRRRAVDSYKALVDGDPDPDVLTTMENGSAIIETAVSVFPVLLLVLVLRSFLFEPFQIPSGSMIPTLEVGDFILVNKFHYGLRLPVTGTKVMSLDSPKRGEVMVFKEPKNENINFIKRVIGLPGDIISYKNKKMTINGAPVAEKFIAQLSDESTLYRLYEENLAGRIHKIRKESHMTGTKNGIWTVPKGHYFVMGDNRDRSNDSRYWGFVPEQNIVGKAIYIWMHWPNWTSVPSLKNNGAIE